MIQFNRLKFLLCSVVAALCTTVAVAQPSWSPASYVKININSGNPAFPYPQFLEYKKGKTLAKYNAEGVTHADMEKAGREAYEIMSHRCRYDGGTHCGVPYITFNNFRKFGDKEMPQGGAEFCTEGDGYMLLAAALFADQATFNGLWMWIHDNRIPHRVRYQDGKVRLPNYEFGGGLPICYAMEGSTSENHGSATDGDDDIALALLVAYKQWGEFMYQDGKQVIDATGKPISYKEACEDFLKAFVDTFAYTSINGDGTLYNGGHMSGNIGVDGYVKGGNKGHEVSSWRNTQTTYPDITQFSNISGGGGDGNTHTDYCAPAYYNEFAKWLESGDVTATDWQINQYKRAEASSDWLCGEAYKQGLCSSLGTTNMPTDGKPTFTNFSEGEDFRSMWRLAQNYLWHGEPEYNWNPTTHQIEKGTNTNEYDMALRTAKIMKEPPAQTGGGIWCGKLGASPDPGQPSFQGPSQIKMCYNINGGVLSHYGANYALGASAPAIVLSEDLDLIADLYRQSELMWDDASGESSSLTDDQRYILSMPKYFHGWFRVMAMLTHTGNWHAPSDMVSAANMKVYMSVDKTYAYVDDKIGYTVQYRNYGSADAKGVQIETEIDKNYEVVSISNGGKFANGKIVWNIGTVPGFKSGGLDATIDSVSFTVIARDTLNPRICLTSKISGSNFDDWVSNEYPNHATYTMERNCVDILANRTLMIKKTANRTKLNPKDAVTFTIDFSNSSEGGEASWMNGGRDHVNLSYGNTIMESYGFRQFYRFWNDAHEAYIDLGNYRLSYFMNDGAAIGLYDPNDNPTGWTFQLDNGNDMTKYGWMPAGANTKFTYQKLPIGSDEHGKWNQRIMIQFPKTLMATTTHVYDKLDSKYLLHKGGWGPCFFRTVLKTNPAQEVPKRVADDWSYDSKLDIKNLDGQAYIYTLLTPNFADFDNLGYAVTQHSRYACDPLNCDNFDRVLVEEFDGYTWRRIIGRGPLPGREAYDVTIIDTIPYELEWVGWKDSTALKDDKGEKIKAKYTPASNPKSAGYTGIIKWTIPTMLVGEEDKLVYICKARDLGCPDVEDTYYMNVAWISSKTDSPDSSRVELMTTCAELPPQIEPQTALFKSASKKKVMNGDEVEYKVKFVNTLGTSVDVDCKSTKNIIKLGNGTLPTVGDAGFKLQTSGNGTPFFFAHDHCYGSDGEVYFTIHNGSNNQETYIVFRYEGGTPGKSDFKGIAMKIMVNKDGNQNFGFYLYNNGKEIDSQGKDWNDSPIQFPGNNKDVKFKFVLKGDKMYMYINDEEDEWSNVLKDWDGLTAKGPGYFGAYVNSNGNADCQLTQFQTNLDYAFDITLGDYLPAELADVTSISDKGEYSSATHSIKWPTFATTTKDAMAPGDSVIYTFNATVKDCAKFVNNYAWATVYGLDSLKVLNTIECGEEVVECDLEDAKIKISAEEICDGDSVSIKVTPTPKSKDYEYTFFFEKEEIGVEDVKVDSIFVKESGTYYAVVLNPSIPNCEVKTSKVSLTVNPLPDATLSSDTTICEGNELSLKNQKIEGFDISWYTDDVAQFPLENVEIEKDEVLKSYYYTLTDKKTGCVGKIETFAINFEAIPAAPTTKKGEFAVEEGKRDITNLASAEDNVRIVWYETEEAKDSLKTPVKIAVDKEAKLTYYVSTITSGGCESERVAVNIEITNSRKPATSDTTLCLGESVDVLSLVKGEEGYELKWVDENGNEAEAPSEYTANEVGTKTFYVAQTDGISTSEPAEITITTYSVGKITAEDVLLCENADAEKLAVSKDNQSLSKFVKLDAETSYEWYLGEVKLSEEALVPTTKVSATTTNTYRIVPTYTISEKHICKGEEIELNVTVTHLDAPEVKNTINYTLQDTTSSGKFENLLKHDAGAVAAAEGNSLIWYDEDGKLLGDVPPTPDVDAKMTDDVTYTYFVSQKDDKGCESEKSKVTVIVSMTPVPKTSDANFCQDETTDKVLSDFVATTDAAYSLVWYDGDPKKGGTEIPMPEISTALKGTDVEETTSYFVAQTDGSSTSSAVKVEIHIFAKPTLSTHFDTVCSKAVNLNSLWEVSNKVTNVYTNFYNSATEVVATPEAVDVTGTYRVEGYFEVPVSKTKCLSELEDIYVEIHTLDDITIEGATSVCPGSSVELKASASGDTYNSVVAYEWNAENKAKSPSDGEFLSEALSNTSSFTVTATDGYCTKTSAPFEVTIGSGSVSGSLSFTDEGGAPEIEIVDGKTLSFYTCGGEFKLDASKIEQTGDDLVWTNNETGDVLSGKSVFTSNEVGTFTLKYTNKCETSFSVKVIDASIKDNTVPADKTLCEMYNDRLVLEFECNDNVDIVWKKDGSVLDGETSKTLVIASAHTDHNGVYSYELSNRDCKVSNVFGTIKVSPAPTYTIKPVDVVCAGTPVEIGVEDLTPVTAKLDWTEDETLVPAGNTAVATPLKETIYSFVISQDGGCAVKESVKVSVVDPIEFSVTPADTVVCEGTSEVRLRLKVLEGDVQSYSWTNAEGEEVATTTMYKAPVSNVGTTTYTVTLTSIACPPASHTINVEVVGTPVIDTFTRISYKNVEFIPRENSGSGGFEYCIDGAEFQSDASFEKVSYGKHTATIRDMYGCHSDFEFALDAPEIDIPVIVSPNGDGVNDVFISETLSEAYPNAKVTIYDRYGKVVAKIPANEGWDGTYNGHKMPSTDYWYEIWIDEIRKSYVGHFTLIND